MVTKIWKECYSEKQWNLPTESFGFSVQIVFINLVFLFMYSAPELVPDNWIWNVFRNRSSKLTINLRFMPLVAKISYQTTTKNPWQEEKPSCLWAWARLMLSLALNPVLHKSLVNATAGESGSSQRSLVGIWLPGC